MFTTAVRIELLFFMLFNAKILLVLISVLFML